MHGLYRCLLAAVLIVTIQPLSAKQDLPGVIKSYLGQRPPGKTPEIFAPGVVSLPGQTEFSCTMSPDGTEFYFARKKPDLNYQVIMESKFENGTWLNPTPVSFSSGMGDFGPMMTPDGRRLFFMSWKPHSLGQISSPDLWFVERTENGWSKPVHFDSPFNPGKALFVSMSYNRNIYTTDAERSDIVLARFKKDKYSDYVNLGSVINCNGLDCYPFVAPDESYLIYTSIRPDISPAPSLFITFKMNDGSWSRPRYIDTGIPNSVMPYVSPDGKYFFFSANADIYWMDASFIEELRRGN